MPNLLGSLKIQTYWLLIGFLSIRDKFNLNFRWQRPIWKHSSSLHIGIKRKKIHIQLFIDEDIDRNIYLLMIAKLSSQRISSPSLQINVRPYFWNCAVLWRRAFLWICFATLASKQPSKQTAKVQCSLESAELKVRPERQVGPRPLEQWKPGATDSPLTEMMMIIVIMMHMKMMMVMHQCKVWCSSMFTWDQKYLMILIEL